VNSAADSVACTIVEVEGVVHLAGVLFHLLDDVGIVVTADFPPAIRVANIGASQVQVPQRRLLPFVASHGFPFGVLDSP
jgi:hypothetical protein